MAMRLAKLVSVISVVLALGGSASVSHANPDYFGGDSPPEQVQFRVERSRTKHQRIVIGALAGGALVFGGAGLLFHLDSRDIANELEAVGTHTGKPWTSALEDRRTRGQRSRLLAGVGYAVGGVLVVGTVVALVRTEPGHDLVGVKTQRTKKLVVPLSVVPLRGGAMASKGWHF